VKTLFSASKDMNFIKRNETIKTQSIVAFYALGFYVRVVSLFPVAPFLEIRG
jgi:hypothetical protein